MERKGREKGNGGLCLFYKPHLRPHKWVPVVSDNCKYIDKERQWLLLNNGKEKLAILHCYLACQNSRSQDFLKWNEDLLHMMTQEIDQLKQQGFIILSLGDYNSHIGRVPGLELNNEDVNENGELFLNFIRLTNLTIINTLPVARGVFTRFMSNTGRDSGRSLIDYGLIDSDHSSYVSSFIIDADARYDCGSDHALLTAKLKFGHNPSVQWEFKDVLSFNLNLEICFSQYSDTFSFSSVIVFSVCLFSSGSINCSRPPGLMLENCFEQLSHFSLEIQSSESE